MADLPNNGAAEDAVEQPGYWEDDASWEDSERFDEDSMGSYLSDTESLPQNWRGWNAHSAPLQSVAAAVSSSSAALPLPPGPSTSHWPPPAYTGGIPSVGGAASLLSTSPATHHAVDEVRYEKKLMSLLDLSARCVAQVMSFDEMEAYTNNYPPRISKTASGGGKEVHTAGTWIQAINEPHVQIRLGYFCFPTLEDDIRLYSCLANGNAEEFVRGEVLYRSNAVKNPLQIGFHLTATVCILKNTTVGNMPSVTTANYNVAVTIDRCKITSCFCSCCERSSQSWCCHVVAMCLMRIHEPDAVQYRATVSESLVRLRDPERLRKFALYLIADLPREFLPTAQHLLDKLLDKESRVNAIHGAPDPTAYTCSDDLAGWWLDEHTLKENIRKILLKFCVPSPTVFSDVNYLSTNLPAVAMEWQALLRPLRSREPEGLWNLLSIVREMYRRHDVNATKLLHIITEKCLNCSQVILWWYQTKLSQSGKYPLTSSSSVGGAGAAGKSGLASNHQNAQYSCSSLCDEIVQLWRLAALNPQLPACERRQLATHLKAYHRRVVEKIWSILEVATTANNGAVQPAGDRQHHLNHHHHHPNHHHQHHHNNAAHHRNHAHSTSAGNSSQTLIVPGFGKLTQATARFDLDAFSGFVDSVTACFIDWSELASSTAACSSPLSIECQSSSAASSSNCCTATSKTDSPHTLCAARSPFSPPGLPILKDKNINVALNGSSSSETITFANASPGMLVTPVPVGGILQQQPQQQQQQQQSSRLLLSPNLPTTSRLLAPVPPTVEPTNAPSSPESGKGSTSPPPSASNNRMADVASSNGSFGAGGGASHSPTESPSPPIDPEAAKLEYLLGIYLGVPSPGDEHNAAHESPPQPRAPAAQVACPLESVQHALDVLTAPTDVTELCWARCEALDAHGYATDACRLAQHLATQMLNTPPELMTPIPAPVAPAANLTPAKLQTTGKRKKKHSNAGATSSLNGSAAASSTNSSMDAQLLVPHPKAMQISRKTCRAYRRVLFLFDILLKPTKPSTSSPGQIETNTANRLLAFRVGVWALETSRQPAATKYLEIELHHLEAEILNALRRLELGPGELSLLRERAVKLRNTLNLPGYKTPCVLPFSLAHFVFETFSCNTQKVIAPRQPGDDQLGFEAALSAMSMKFGVSEVEHALLSEGTRRLRGDIAIALLMRYKDATEKIAQILDRLLDPSMNRMYKNSSSNAAYYGHHLHRTVNTTSQPGPSRPDQSSSSTADDARDANDDEVARLATRVHSAAVVSATTRTSTDGETSSRQISRETSPQSSVLTTTTDEDAGSQHGLVATDPPQQDSARSTPSKPQHNNNVTNGNTSTNSKSRRRAGAPGQPNQPSEAHAHYMTELAKRLLTEAGGSHSTAIFNAPPHLNANGGAVGGGHGAAGAGQNGPHRQLHLAAFQIGLYALGLNNRVTPNWPSRTYSSHVSWIHGQAIEIGRTAIRILIDCWQNHLTPAEVASLADKAAQGRELGMVQAAAELALSALPYANALNHNEIQRALGQCREQNTAMLERACIAVESAAKDYGVGTETLFMVAHRWHELHLEHERRANNSQPNAHPPPPHHNMPPIFLQQQMGQPQAVLPNGGVAYGQQQPQRPSMSYASMQQAALFHHHHHHNLLMPPPAHVGQMPPPIPPPLPYAGAAPNMRPGFGPYVLANAAQQQAQSTQAYGPPPHGMSLYAGRPPTSASLHLSHSAPNLAPLHPMAHSNGAPHHHQNRRHAHYQSHSGAPEEPHGRHIATAYRVGMLAMETMGRRLHEDRSYLKFGQNPPYGDDVLWLFGIAQQLGYWWTYQFCLAAVHSVVSPFVLNTLLTDAVRLFPNNPSAATAAAQHQQQQQQQQQPVPILAPLNIGSNSSANGNNLFTQRLQSVLREIANSGQSPPVTNLMQRCLQMFYTAANQKLSHTRFLPSDVEEVCCLVRAAKAAFFLHLQRQTAEILFGDYLQHLRRQKSCKKDVWAKISAVAYPTPQ